MMMFTTLCTSILALAAGPAQQPFAGAAAPEFDAEPFQEPERPQEPFLTWDSEIEDAYRRALHLMDVRARYAEAAEILLGLMDEDQVILMSGQASWVGAKAAEALYQAGRADEAEALIPGIRRGAEGTQYEEPVDAMLAYLERFRQEAGALDPVFLHHVENSLGGSTWSSVTKYGRQAHPYLLHLMQEQGGARGSLHLAQRALAVGLSTADASFVAQARAWIAESPPLRLATMLDGFGLPEAMDRQAQDARTQFLLALATHEDPAVQAACVRTLVYLLHRERDPHVAEFLKEALHDPVFPAHRELLDALAYHERQPVQREILEHAARSPLDEVTEAARWKIAYSGEGLPLLARWAETGDHEDVIRFLAPITRLPQRGSGAIREHLQPRWERIIRDVGGDPDRVSSPPRPHGVPEPLPEEANAALAALVQADHDDVQFLAMVAALAYESWDAARLGLEQEPEPWLHDVFAIWDGGFPPVLDEPLLALLDDERFADAAAGRMIDSRAYARLAVPDIHRLGDRITEDRWNAVVSNYERIERWDGLHALVTDEVVPSRTRAYALELLQRGGRDITRHFAVIPALRDQEGVVLNVIGRWADPLREKLQTGEPLSGQERADLLHACQALARAGLAENRIGYLDQVLHRIWEVQPEQAQQLFLQLLKDEDTSAFAVSPLRAKPRDPGAPYLQTVLFALNQGVAIEALHGNLSWLPARAPEAEQICRLILQRGDSVDMVLGYLRDHQSMRRALESEIQEYWNDPEHAPSMVAIYAEAPDVREWVPRMLGVWDLQGIGASDRSSLVHWYGLTLDERVVPLLLEQLGSPDRKIAEAAAKALERMREVKEQRAFWETWQATGGAQSPALALLGKVDDDDPVVRIAAIRSLGTLAAKEALPKLVELLEDENADVRAAAAEALQRINDAATPGTPARPDEQERTADGSGDSADSGASDG